MNKCQLKHIWSIDRTLAYLSIIWILILHTSASVIAGWIILVGKFCFTFTLDQISNYNINNSIQKIIYNYYKIHVKVANQFIVPRPGVKFESFHCCSPCRWPEGSKFNCQQPSQSELAAELLTVALHFIFKFRYFGGVSQAGKAEQVGTNEISPLM